MDTYELITHELHHATPRSERESRHRADALSARRQARRQRLAARVRSVADRLDA